MVVALFRTLEFKKYLLPILLSNDGSFYFTQDRFFLRNKSCSCTTCIVYVNLFKDRFFYVGFLFRKADAKVKTFKYIFQIFSEVFFIFPFSRHLSCERENKRKIVLPTRIQEKSVSTNAAYFLKAGAKVRTLFHIFQMFSEVFFILLFKGEIPERNKPQAEEIGKSSYAVPVRMSKHRCFRSRKRVQK